MSKAAKTVALLAIIIGGLLLRLEGLYREQGFHAATSGDEVSAYQNAIEFAAGEERAQYIGHQNFKDGKLPGPLWALFWLAGLKLGGSPDSVCLLIIILSTTVIYLVYQLAEKLLGSEYSLWAALFYATSPWAVHYSFGTINVLPMAFLGGLLYLALWDVVTHENSPRIFWVCVILAAMAQFHMVVMFLAPVVLLILALSFSRINRRWLAAGALMSAALYIPYIVGETRHGWDNTRAIFGGRMEMSPAVLKVFTLPVTSLSNLINSLTGKNFSDYRAFGNAYFGSVWLLVAFNVVSLALAAVIIGSFLAEFVAALRKGWPSLRQAFANSPAEVFIGLLLFLPVLLFITSFHNFSSHYLIPQFPLLFLLPAIFVVRGLARSSWRKPVLAALVVMVAFNIYLTLASFQYLGGLIEAGDQFLPSFRKMEMVRQRLKADAGPENRIHIDAAVTLANETGWVTSATTTLAGYIDAREKCDPTALRATGVMTYHVLPGMDRITTNHHVAYAGNGIVIDRSN